MKAIQSIGQFREWFYFLGKFQVWKLQYFQAI